MNNMEAEILNKGQGVLNNLGRAYSTIEELSPPSLLSVAPFVDALNNIFLRDDPITLL